MSPTPRKNRNREGRRKTASPFVRRQSRPPQIPIELPAKMAKKLRKKFLKNKQNKSVVEKVRVEVNVYFIVLRTFYCPHNVWLL